MKFFYFLSKVFFKYLLAAFKVKIDYTHFGTNYGGWKIPKKHVSKLNWIISAGAGCDISFEVEFFLANSDSKILILDPTKFGIEHFEKFSDAVNIGESILINDGKQRHPLDQVKAYPKLDLSSLNNIQFLPIGLSQRKEMLRFYEPADKEMISFSTEQKNSNYIELECDTVENIMKAHSMEKIDVLKMDIEGSEFGVISHLNSKKILPPVLLMEIHVFNFKQIIDLIRTAFYLIKWRYRMYYVDGDNYGFIRLSK